MSNYDLDSQEGMKYAMRSLLGFKQNVEKMNLPVALFELKELRDDVKALKRAFYTFAFSVVGSAVLFAFSVFALLGKHP